MRGLARLNNAGGLRKNFPESVLPGVSGAHDVSPGRVGVIEVVTSEDLNCIGP